MGDTNLIDKNRANFTDINLYLVDNIKYGMQTCYISLVLKKNNNKVIK